MIRYLLFLLLASFSIPSVSYAQMVDPVDWSFQKKKLDDETWELKFTADIDPGWSVYSQFIDEGGPVPTSINFESEDGYELIGETKESGTKNEGFDELFAMDVVKFSERMILTQKVKVSPGVNTLSGYVEYMTCDDSRCLPPMPADFSFSFDDEPQGTEESSVGQEDDQGGMNFAMPEKSSDFGGMETSVPESDILNPISWNARVTNHDDGQSATLVFEGVVQDGWYIYSSQMVKDQGPVPIAIHINDQPEGYELAEMEEIADRVSEDYDNIFEIDVIKVEGDFVLKQYLTFTDDSEPISGFIEYMSCTSEECIFPPVLEFVYNPADGQIMIDDGSGGDEILASEEEMISGLIDYYKLNPEKLESADAENCIAAEDNHTLIEGAGLWRIFFLGLIGGLIALLTPCVFPMIPLTVSYFTKSGEKESKSGPGKAILYGAFILIIYLLFSLPFYFLDSINPDILNNIATNVGLNLFFFLIFLFFAFSFFGYYELTLPSSWTNRVSQAEGAGGFIGIFFMALTLVLVSFSCTGPILGSLLAGSLSTNGGAVQLTVGMGGFGLSLALPFAIFATFPSFMNRLPRSGSWLNSVKVVMGFVELALAFKFLSNADLVKNWGILKIEPFLILWALVAIGLGLYLFGLIRFPNDSKGIKISMPRKALGLLSFAFAIYLFSGFRYNEETQTFRSLTLLSGLAPPVGYSWIHPNDCPNNINCFKDLEAGMAYAEENDLPVIIDFSGYACVNCRKMEEHVWPNPGIKEMLHTDFVLISLYVDDRTLLPEEEQVTLPRHNGGERTLRTVGDKWHFFQTEYFRNNSQPFYALLDSQGKLLNKPVGYTPSVDDFRTFLQCGLDIYKERNGFGGSELIGKQ